MNNIKGKGEFVSQAAMGLLVGLSLMLAGFLTGRQLHIVWNIWPSIDGVVVRGRVQQVLQTPYAKGVMPLHRYVPMIEFRYTVGGTKYSTEAPSVYLADTYNEAAARLVNRYAPGTHYPIRYNPRNPTEIEFGAIELSTLAISFLLLVGGIVLLVAGLKALVMGYWQAVKFGPATAPAVMAAVLPFSDGAQQGAPATLRCPACGRLITAAEETCPNCLKYLRAA